MRKLRRIRKLSLLLREQRYRRALRYRVAAAVEHEAVLRSVACRTVIDIGANVGQFSLVSRAAMPDARVIAFEPLQAPAEVFRCVFRDDPNVMLHQLAIGPTSMRASMHVSARVDSSSLLPITANQTRTFPGTAWRAMEEVSVEPLSAMVPADAIVPPALLKLDVQGFEGAALRGCDTRLPMFDFVYVECSFVELYEDQALVDEIVDFLRERGFGLQGIHNMTYDGAGRSVQADFLFARRRRVVL